MSVLYAIINVGENAHRVDVYTQSQSLKPFTYHCVPNDSNFEFEFDTLYAIKCIKPTIDTGVHQTGREQLLHIMPNLGPIQSQSVF